MRRTPLASLVLIALAWTSGCAGGGGVSPSGGNTTPSPALLNGQYAFVLSGFDPANPIAIAGSFKADGQGNITAGDVDVNDNGIHSSSISLAGTYAFDTLPTGTIGLGTLGTITLTNAVGSVTHLLKFGFSINSAGTFGSIMDLSANNFIVAGTVQKQSVFTLAGLAGSYAVILNGLNFAKATSVIGRFTLAADGTTSNLSFDRSIAGVGTAGPTATALTVTATLAATDASGRGTLNLTLNDGLPNAGTQNFAYYAISNSRFVAAETDANGTMMFDASSQAIPNSASTTGSAFGMAGFDTVNSSEVTAVGQLLIANPATSGTIADDSNDNGAINTNAALAIPTVTFNALTGRGTATVTNGLASGLTNSLVFYLTTAGTGFIMDNAAAATDRALTGTLTAQTGVGSFSTATDLPGAAIVRAKGLALSDAQAFVGEFSLTNVAATYAFVADQRNSGSTTLDNPISPITVGGLSATTGRGTFVNGSETLAFYVIAPNQAVFIGISPAGNPNNGASALFFATPD